MKNIQRTLANPCVVLKTSFSLLGSIFIFGGEIIFTETSLLDYLEIEDNITRVMVASLSFSFMAYILIFSRGISLLNYYSDPYTLISDTVQQVDEPSITVPFSPIHNLIGSSLGVFTFINTIVHSLFSSFLASKSLSRIINHEGDAIQFVSWGYFWISLVIVDINFTLPKAVNNGKDIALIVLSRNEHNNIIVPNNEMMNKKEFAKMSICTFLGTISFAALTLFVIQNATQSIPIAKYFSSTTKNAIAVLLAITSSIVFALAKGMESYQYFSHRRHFDNTLTEREEYSKGIRLLLGSHKIIGCCYLLSIFSAYYRLNLNLLVHLGVDIELKAANTPWFTIAAIFSLASATLEYVFSYQNMMALTRKKFTPLFFSNHSSEENFCSLIQEDDTFRFKD